MERLTKTYSDGSFGVADKLPCGENSHAFKKLLIDTLGAYETAEEQGLLVQCGQEPLRIEQLKGMDGKPVYTVTGIHLPCENDIWWGILNVVPYACMMYFYGVGRIRSVDIEEYGKTWLAYDHEPKEVSNETD